MQMRDGERQKKRESMRTIKNECGCQQGLKFHLFHLFCHFESCHERRKMSRRIKPFAAIDIHIYVYRMSHAMGGIISRV